MRVLLISNRFSPDYGGIETVALSLAEGLADKGWDVEVLTHTEQISDIDARLRVTRNPGMLRLYRSYRDADIILHNNICLRLLWPMAIMMRKPLLFAIHNWLLDESGKIGLRERIKRTIIARSRSVCVSRAVQASLPFSSTLIYNSYKSSAFNINESVHRSPNSVAFVGRLIEGKGCLVLVEALAVLRDRGLSFSCSIIGDGVERRGIEERVAELGLEGVDFLGSMELEEIGVVLRKTEVLAVPSHYGEAFGIVALEGVASGCFVVTSDDGGLPEAVGKCGLSVPQKSAECLAEAIEMAWTRKLWDSQEFQAARAAHLDQFSEKVMLDRYSLELEKALTDPRAV